MFLAKKILFKTKNKFSHKKILCRNIFILFLAYAKTKVVTTNFAFVFRVIRIFYLCNCLKSFFSQPKLLFLFIFIVLTFREMTIPLFFLIQEVCKSFVAQIYFFRASFSVFFSHCINIYLHTTFRQSFLLCKFF